MKTQETLPDLIARIPLGNHYKCFKQKGDVDVDGKIVEEKGYFYGWWRGLQCLIDEEHFDTGLYRIRPRGEQFKGVQ